MKRTPDLLLRLAAVLLPLLALAAAAMAQDDSRDDGGVEQAAYFERVEVNVINVDVYVTDKDDRPVRGLTADDFELFEDGRPVPISNFYAVDGEGRAAAAPAAPAPVAGEPAGGVEPLPVPTSQQLHLILYFDNLYLKPFDRNKVVRQARQFLRTQVGPDDEVMLVSFDKSLHVRHPFTTDRAAIAEALFGLEKLSGFAEQKDSSRREVIRGIERARSALDAESEVDFFAKSEYHDLTTSLDALKELVGSLAGLPGRKALLYVSDGLPMTPGEDLFLLLESTFQGSFSGKLLASRYDARSRFRELVAHANANRVSFYTLEAAGLRSHASLSAENPGAGGGRLAGGSYLDVDFARMSNMVEPLQMMALDTGGLAAFSTNDIAGALERMAQDFTNYYSLGYLPPHSGDGRYHSIEVKVKGRGLTVRHRTGYRDKSAETRISEGTVATLLFGGEKNPLAVEVDVKNAVPRDEGDYLVPVDVRIPIGKMALIPRESLHEGRLRVSVAVVDDEGRLSPVEQTPIPITIPEGDLEVARSKFYIYSVELLMRKGQQSIAVGVSDELAGETSYVRTPVRIGV